MYTTYFRSLLRRWKMPHRKELLSLCRQIAPLGSSMWTVQNGVRFQFYHGSNVWVSIEDHKTGVVTELWDSDLGFRTHNETLRNWFEEAVELLVIEYHNNVANSAQMQAEQEQSLMDQYETRFRQDKTSTME